MLRAVLRSTALVVLLRGALAPAAAQEMPLEALFPCLGCPSLAQLEQLNEETLRETTFMTVEEGRASFYGRRFDGRRTASGEVFDCKLLTAAHPSLPFDSVVRVTNLGNGRSVLVRVNDRGPFTGNRVIDLSRAAAEQLGMIHHGVVRVRVELQVPVEDAG